MHDADGQPDPDRWEMGRVSMTNKEIREIVPFVDLQDEVECSGF